MQILPLGHGLLPLQAPQVPDELLQIPVQTVTAAFTQEPLPLHSLACELTGVLQLLPQPMPIAAFLQAPLPSHLPVLPQVLLDVSSVHESLSVPLLGTLAQLPEAQVWQVPQELDPQQVPSTQLPDMHCPPALQLSPFAFNPQLLPLQVPTEQWLSMLQVFRHDVPSQVKLPQDCVLTAGQAPAPSHLASLVCVVPVQLFARQTVLVPHLRQAPLPSHLPSFPQVVSAAGAQPLFGSASPEATLRQVPTEPCTVQLLQVSLQAALQQTLFTQKPD